jgi:hypothetical protein
MNLRFITTFPSGPYISKINPTTSSRPIHLSYVLILSSHINLGLPISLFLSDFLTEILYEFHFFDVVATYSTHIIVLDLKVINIYCYY